MEHECGFSCTVGTEQGDLLAAPISEVDAEEGLVAIGVREREPFDVEDRRRVRYHVDAARTATRAATAGNESALIQSARRARDATRSDLAAVAARCHREIHPFPALVRADEQRARCRGDGTGLPDPPRVVSS